MSSKTLFLNPTATVTATETGESLEDGPPSRRWICLSLILFVALTLRVWGLHWGLPATGPFFHGSSFHPDEQGVLEILRELSWKRRQFYPSSPDRQILSRGTLQVYIVGAALGITYPWLVFARDREVYKKRPEALARLYLVGRVVSVVQSLAAVAALFWLGTLMVHWKVGAGAAALMAVAPVQVVNAHYISADSAFCLYLILLVVAGYYIFKTARLRSYLAAGVLLGLLTANKYNAASAGLIIVIAHVLSDSPQKNVRSLAAGMAVAGLVFVACTPAVIFGFHDFWSAIRQSVRVNLTTRHFMYDGGYPPSALRFYTWDVNLYGLGLPLLVACFAGMVYALTRFSRVDWLWAAWVFFFWFLLFQTEWRLLRWGMPLTSFFFLATARMWNDAAFWGLWKPLRNGLAGAVLGYTALYSFSYVQAMTLPDTRDTSSEWIVKNIPRGARIALYGHPYFWAPTIFQSPFYHPEEAEALRRERGYEMFYLIEGLKDLRKARPTHVSLACYDFNVYLKDPKYYQNFPQGQLMAELFDPALYKVRAVFEKQLQFMGQEWFGNTFNFPHDWRYPFPKILILEKQGPDQRSPAGPK